VREIQSFKFWGATNNCLDPHRPIEQEARTVHQATQIIFNDPEYAEIYKLLNKHGRTIAKRNGEYMPPQNSALKDALVRAQAQPKEAKKEAPVPQVPHLRGPSKLKQVQAALEPLLPQFAKLFTKADAEEMLRTHGHAGLIDKHSVHNALQGWLAEKPQRHIKRVRAPDKQKTLGYEVLEEAKNLGRKAAKRARAATPEAPPEQHALLGATEPVVFDPASTPLALRNSAYAEKMRTNGHSNGHSPEEKQPVQEPGPPAAPSPAPAPPPAPAGALAAQQKADILTLLASGMAETTEADMKEFEEAETMMLEGMDRMRRVVKKTGGFLSFRARAAELFGAVTP
jgi:hypothetical protein